MKKYHVDFHANTVDGNISTVWSVTKTSYEGKECYAVVKNIGHPKSETHYIFAIKQTDNTTSWQDQDGKTTEEFTQIGMSITDRNNRVKQ